MNEALLDQGRRELISRIVSRYEGNSKIKTVIEPLSFYVSHEPTEMLATLYEPSICVIFQGAKAVGMGEELFHYDPHKFLLASVHTPARVRITEASQARPYMGMTLTFSMEQIFEVLQEIGEVKGHASDSQRSLYFGPMEPRLFNPVQRLVRLLDTPQDAKVLAPLIIKEILYILICGEGGEFIRQYIRDGHSTQRVVKAITQIKEHFAETLNVKELAKSVGMSESSLYANFKKITAMSPLQFQKQLRLQTARQLLLSQNITATEVAYEVGYESPSQFSREYSRMYGLSPKADANRMAGDSAV
jgi:AraC-like DNA-binding protein